MGRPRKDGVDFFSLDTGIFRDDKVKLLRAEFGAKGMYLLIWLLCEIYEKNGYYMQWGSDKCYLVSDGAGCACSPKFVSEFVRGCVARSFFDERVFNVFGVLTSESIQRRFLRAVRNRPNIEIVADYFLLNVNSKKDVPEGSLANCTFVNLSDGKTVVFSSETPEKATDTPQRKEEIITSNNLSISLSRVREERKETAQDAAEEDEPIQVPADEFGDPIDPAELTDPEEIESYREAVKYLADARKQTDIGGIFISRDQLDELAGLLSPEEMDHYLKVVRDCVARGRKPRSAYDFILKMARTDRRVRTERAKKMGGGT
nr:MAG TPA: protein of unknown function (DUF4373) [Caudoviricetes sp.]